MRSPFNYLTVLLAGTLLCAAQTLAQTVSTQGRQFAVTVKGEDQLLVKELKTP